jgi:hypothetical protein
MEDMREYGYPGTDFLLGASDPHVVFTFLSL